MRKIVVLIDIIVFIFVVYIAISEFDAEYQEDSISFIIILILLAINIFYVLKPNKSEGNWLFLYFKRKALEEKKKINDLLSK